MGRTVKELLESIDSRELTEWMLYYKMQPFGDDRGDMQAGITAAMLRNIHSKPGAKPVSPADFLLYAQRPENTEADRLKSSLAYLVVDPE